MFLDNTTTLNWLEQLVKKFLKIDIVDGNIRGVFTFSVLSGPSGTIKLGRAFNLTLKIVTRNLTSSRNKNHASLHKRH